MTGGSLGIGRAVVQRLAQEGKVSSVVAAAGGRAIALRADLGSLPEVRSLFEQAEQSLGGLDIAVLNAGVVGGGTVAEPEEGTYDSAPAGSPSTRCPPAPPAYCASRTRRKCCRS
ncbi:MAG TPA: SDR family NAD(P)-dependent oxidoreductase [Pseudonocardiaceae bacterium]|nr:SDR family NAD(P)-dependent oxidoreductase [Pseudonocardiaceae bacterium]